MKRTIRYRAMTCALVGLFLLAVAPIEGGAPEGLYGPGPERWVFSQAMILDAKGVLLAAGYDVNSVEDLRRAMTDANSTVRLHVPIWFAHKTGRGAIPAVKPALDDPNPLVRCMTARVMGILGDLSGLDRMRKEIATFTEEAAQKDHLKQESEAVRRNDLPWAKLRGQRLRHAVWAATVLAEFGDCSGYTLAAEAAVQEKSGAIRSEAWVVLAHLGRIDSATLRARGCAPEAVLLVVAEAETDPFLLECLYGCVKGRMRPESAIRIIEKVSRSPHLSNRLRGFVNDGLSDLRKQLEKEKQAGGQKRN